MTTAKQKFEKGDFVRKTVRGEEALKAFRCLKPSDGTGIVVGFGRVSTDVRILVNGYKYPATYHMDFWYPFKRTI